MSKVFKDISSIGAGYQGIFTPTRHDVNADPAGVIRGVQVVDDGNVAITFLDGSFDTIPLKAGIIYPFIALNIRATGTTATTIKCYL